MFADFIWLKSTLSMNQTECLAQFHYSLIHLVSLYITYNRSFAFSFENFLNYDSFEAVDILIANLCNGNVLSGLKNVEGCVGFFLVIDSIAWVLNNIRKLLVLPIKFYGKPTDLLRTFMQNKDIFKILFFYHG